MDLGGSDISTQQERVWIPGPEVLSTTIPYYFYYLIHSVNFFYEWVLLFALLYWKKNPRKREVKLRVWGHMSHQPGLEWATFVLLTLILVSVVSLITEFAGWLRSRPSFLQIDLFFFFKSTNVLKISHKWANIMHGSLNQLTCQV